jgi:hypothetical protein
MAGSRRRRRVVAQELEKVSLGDPRRERRAVALAERLAAEPEATLPFAMVDRAMLEAAYRHLSNREVSFDALLAPHVEKTAARVAEAGDVYAVHDTTICAFSGETRRSGLGTVNLADQGFLAHVTLAVAADGTRLPLGVLATELLVRTERKHTRERHHFYRTKDADKESQRWQRGVDRSSEMVKSPERLVHVADREGDIFELVANLKANGRRFIIRAAQDRAVEVNGISSHLFDAAQETPTRYAVEVPLSKRAKVRWPRYPHAPRNYRVAQLSVAATSMKIRRPAARPDLPQSVVVNVVHVFELGPPLGDTPVEWLLLTSEAIDTREEIERVLEGYRARWTIEEYFKAIKTGCAYESRQLESFHALSNLLAYTLIVAYALLLMRALSRAKQVVPATHVLGKSELEVLRLASKKKLGKTPQLREAMLAIASLGGHLPSNGEPGWRVLSRGWRRLRDYAAGYRLARGEM